ncbi:MAG: helix-turn-helix transcriptional regulator [Bacteroidota bacterium]
MLNEKEIIILVGKNIRKIRKEKGITQEQLAYDCNFEKSTISRIEAGRANLTLKTMIKLSQSLGVELKDLVDIN